MVEDKTKIREFDGHEIYCRKLGHHLSFNYCRQEQQQLPCNAIKRCWRYRIPVEKFLAGSFSSFEIAHLNESHAPKISSILDIARKVRKERTVKPD